MLDPFKELASGLSKKTDIGSIYEETPVEFETFVCDKKFLNLKWNGRTGCRPKILEIGKAVADDKVREAMLLIGKGSEPYDTKVVMSNGDQIEIGKLYDEYKKNNKPYIFPNFNLDTNKPSFHFGVPKYSGKKHIYEVFLSNGISFKTSLNHKMVTYNGYRKLEKLRIGDCIATYRDLSFIDGDACCSNEVARFIGYMIADGCIGGCNGELGFSFTTSYEETKNDFLFCLNSIDANCEPRIDIENPGGKYRKKYHICFYGNLFSTEKYKKRQACNASEILHNCGLFGKRSGNKFVPKMIMSGTKEIIGNFLSAYWTCDGECNNGAKNVNATYYYSCSSKSKQLMIDVHYLLRRIGVNAKLNSSTKFVKCIGRKNTGHEVHFTDYVSICNFFKYVKLLRKKGINQKKSLVNKKTKGKGCVSKTDCAPEFVLFDCVMKLEKLESSGKFKVKNLPAEHRGFYAKKTINYKTLQYFEDNIFGGKRDFVNGCISYEKIIKTKYIGHVDAYDITIISNNDKKYKNYIVEGSVAIGNSGKDFVAAVLHLYGIYKSLCMYDPQSYYGLATGSPIYYINVARNETQAKNVFFSLFKGMLDNCLWFKGKYTSPLNQQVAFEKRIMALSGNSQAFGWLGYNTIQWVGDELAFFLENDTNEDSASKAEECWEAAYGSCQTRFPKHYKMIGITTPRYDDDFVMKKFYELGERSDGYSVQAATWDIHPSLTKEDFKNALIRDYRRTMRDFGAIPMGVIESFWGDPEFIEANVCEKCRHCEVYQNRAKNTDPYACRINEDCKANGYLGNGEWREWFIPENDKEYFMHFDLSKNKDRLSFSLAHAVGEVKVDLTMVEILQKKTEKEINEIKDEDSNKKSEESVTEVRPLIKVDAIGWVDPKNRLDHALIKNKEIYYNEIFIKIILKLRNMGFNLVKITFDQFNSHYMKQQIEDAGIETDLLSLDRTDEVPVKAKNIATENRLEYPYDKVLCAEAKKLKYVKGKKVDHPSGGSELGNSKDVWDSFAGTIYNCEIEYGNAGTFVPMGEDND